VARKAGLRKQREGTVINLTSQKQETELGRALKTVERKLRKEFGQLRFHHARELALGEVVEGLRREFPDVDFATPKEGTSMRPDGGILSVVDREGNRHPVLIAEVKNQGTNDLRAAEGKSRQASGNAIERLGKNVIGFRAAMLAEDIMPFVCFGYGCDFATESSIRDRVVTIAMFGPLNRISVMNEGEAKLFNRGSFFFREKEWGKRKMAEVMHEVARRSIDYYFAKLGRNAFKFPA
jgi:type II restriction enzyme